MPKESNYTVVFPSIKIKPNVFLYFTCRRDLGHMPDLLS